MIKILLTAFEPFGKDVENASAIVCQQIPSQGAEYHIEKRILPTEFIAGAQALMEAMDETMPEIVICLGQAGGRKYVTPERVAINLKDASIPDNAGDQPDEVEIIPGGPTAYLTNMPIKAVVQQASEAGYPAQVSNSAGLYVCNDIFYTLMNRIAYTPANEMTPAIWGDFIHIPYLAEQQGIPEGMPTMITEQVVETVVYLIQKFVEYKLSLQL